MAIRTGFKRIHLLSADLYEDAIWPVFNLKIPGWAQRWSHKYGIYILETMNTGRLADEGVHEFMFVLGQARLKGAVQMIINPVAMW